MYVGRDYCFAIGVWGATAGWFGLKDFCLDDISRHARMDAGFIQPVD